MGSLHRRAICRSEGHSPASAGGERRPRRDDCGAKLVLAGRQPAERGLAGISRCWTWFALPVRGLFYQTRRSVSLGRIGVSRILTPRPRRKDVMMLVLAIGTFIDASKIAPYAEAEVATIHAH